MWAFRRLMEIVVVLGLTVGAGGQSSQCQWLWRESTNADMVKTLQNEPFSIGYTGSGSISAELEAQNSNIKELKLAASDGTEFASALSTVPLAMGRHIEGNKCSRNNQTCLDEAHGHGAGSAVPWPLTAITYVIMLQNITLPSDDDCRLQPRATYDYFRWMVSSDAARNIVSNEAATIVPVEDRDFVLSKLDAMHCNGKKISTYATDSVSQIRLAGAGSSLAVNLFSRLNNEYTLQQVFNVIVAYEGTSSSQGRAAIESDPPSVNFAGADVFWTVRDANVSEQFLAIPLFASPVVAVANVNFTTENIVVDGPILDDIFLSRLSCWNDTRLKSLNPDVNFPGEGIKRVVRNISSGTTRTFSSGLATLVRESCDTHALECSSKPDWPLENVTFLGPGGICPCTITDSIGPQQESWIRQNVGALTILIIAGASLILGIFVCAFSVIRNRDEKLWRVGWQEVTFPDPPEILGQGAFGVVTKAIFRGEYVACKRLMSPSQAAAFALQTVNASNKSLAAQYDVNAPGHKSGQAIPIPSGHSLSAYTSGGHGTGERKEGDAHAPKDRRTMLLLERGAGLNKETRKSLVAEVKVMIHMRHPNLCPIMGACLEIGREFLLMQFFEYGSIRDMMNNRFPMSQDIQIDLAAGIAAGMQYVHLSALIHKDLKAANVLVDVKLSAKVSDFGMTSATSKQGERVGTLFWNAPELLDGQAASTHTDVYAYGITVYEIFHPANMNIYGGHNLFQIIQGVKAGILRPEIDSVSVPTRIQKLMERCWSQDSEGRPDFTTIVAEFAEFQNADSEQESSNEEEETDSEGSEEEAEAYSLFPPSVAEKLEQGLKIDPQQFDQVTLLFADIARYKRLSRQLAPNTVKKVLAHMHDVMDRLCKVHSVFKIHTIGTSYMVAAGLPDPQPDHAARVARFASDILNAVREMSLEVPSLDNLLQLRIGCHSGSVVASVVGNQTLRYCLFGQTVNVTSQLELTSRPDRIQISNETYAALVAQAESEFEGRLVSRGMVAVRGRGTMQAYWLLPDNNANGSKPEVIGSAHVTATVTMASHSHSLQRQRSDPSLNLAISPRISASHSLRSEGNGSVNHVNGNGHGLDSDDDDDDGGKRRVLFADNEAAYEESSLHSIRSSHSMHQSETGITPDALLLAEDDLAWLEDDLEAFREPRSIFLPSLYRNEDEED